MDDPGETQASCEIEAHFLLYFRNVRHDECTLLVSYSLVNVCIICPAKCANQASPLFWQSPQAGFVLTRPIEHHLFQA